MIKVEFSIQYRNQYTNRKWKNLNEGSNDYEVTLAHMRKRVKEWVAGTSMRILQTTEHPHHLEVVVRAPRTNTRRLRGRK